MTLRWQRAALGAALALALLAQSRRGWHRVEASVLVGSVQRQMKAFAGVAPPRRLLGGADLALRRAHRLDPAAVEPLAFAADLLLVAGRLADADRAYRRAAAHEPRPEVLFHWGLAQWRQGRAAEAAVQVRRAVALMQRLERQVPADMQDEVARAPLVPIPPLDPAVQ